MPPETFRCYLVSKDDAGAVSARIATRRLDELPAGEVLVRVDYSSLNYKDALAATGVPGVAKTFPHIPGIDAAGRVASSGAYEFVEDDQALVTGFEMGANRWGGYAEYVRVPQDWVVPLPQGLSIRESMILGTAGFTAGLCVGQLERNEVRPTAGEVVVTGASGGVGSFAVAILAKLGYQVTAVTGKASAQEYLKSLGAAAVVPREAVSDDSGKPLLKGRWAAAVDTVGGPTLGALLRSVKRGGCVAACGNVGGFELPITVHPFILRGVVLAGVDSAWCPIPLRHQTWDRLARDWKPDCLTQIAEFIEMDDLPSRIEAILAGQVTGRVVVRVGAERTE